MSTTKYRGDLPDATRDRNPSIATLFALASVGLPLIFFVIAGPRTYYDPLLLALTVVTLVASAGRLTLIIGSGETPILATIFWMFIYITAAVVPLAEIYTNLYPFLMDSRYLVAAQALSLVAGLSYEIGRATSRRRKWALLAVEDFRTISFTRLKILCLIAIAGSSYYIAKVGGPATLFASRRELGASIEQAGLRSDSQVESALTMTLGQIPVFVALLVLIVHLIRNPEARTLRAYLMLTVLGGLNIIVNNPVTNARFWVLTVALGFLFALPGFTTKRLHSAIVLGLFAAIIVFPYTDYFRDAAETRKAVVVQSIAEKISTKDFDQLVMSANGMWWVADHGFTMGKQLLGAIFFWVPRQIWPDKGMDTGVEIGLAMNTANVNLSSPLPLEFWVDFGWIGLLVGFVLIGAASERADQIFNAARLAPRSSVLLVDILIPVLAGYTFIVMRGPLLQSMSRLAALVFVCLFIAGPRLSRLTEHTTPRQREFTR